MAREDDKEKKKSGEKKIGLHREVKIAVMAIFLLAVSLITFLSLFGLAGDFGKLIKFFSEAVFGGGAFLVPVFLLLISILILRDRRRRFSAVLGTVLLLLSILGLFYIFGFNTGYLGSAVSFPFLHYAGVYAASIIFLAVVISSFLIVFNIPFSKISRRVKREKPEEDEKKEQEAPVSSASLLNHFKKKEAEQKPAPFLSVPAKGGGWSPLPPDLLDQRQTTPASIGNTGNNKKIIKETLENFGIEVEMGEARVGPTVTQYTFRPAMGVKLTKITSLQNDLALALAAHPLRIEAPIPGRSLVGLEVPNQKSSIVRLGPLLTGDEFKKQNSSLSFVLGRDVAGEAVFADLANMPHLLLAGATGAGKSVGLNALIISLVYRNSPEELKLLIIDPKRVDLVAYEDVPHLISPVITDHKKAIEALNWAVHEMEDRFKKLQLSGSRDITSFNGKNPEDKLPYLVLVIDELSDLMFVSAREVEAMVVRLSQMSRAVGIHLIISTQRPSVNVITGLIKANIPSRIAFQVATQVDSRTILDMAGAEKLLGCGDMLFMPRDFSKPKRVQGAFVSEAEVVKVVKHLKQLAREPRPTFIPEVEVEKQMSRSELAEVPIDDDMFSQARDLVIEIQRASASLIQRHLRVGYARAARLLDLLEAKGVVGPYQGSKPRRVLVRKEEGN